MFGLFKRAAAVRAAQERDDALCRRLFVELPKLATQARTIPYPDAASALRPHLAVVGRMNNLAAKVGRFPSALGLRPSLTQIESLADRSSRACECLDLAWQILATSPVDMLELAGAVTALEIAIHLRQSA